MNLKYKKLYRLFGVLGVSTFVLSACNSGMGASPTGFSLTTNKSALNTSVLQPLCDSAGRNCKLYAENNYPAKASGAKTTLKVVEYNLDKNGGGGEKGTNERGLQAIIDLFKPGGKVGSVDVIMVSEINRGCRSTQPQDNYIDGPAEIARQLHMNFVYGVEFNTPGDALPGQECTEGNAIFSKYPLDKAAVKQFKDQYHPPEYNRTGARVYVTGEINKDLINSDKNLVLFSTHLEAGSNGRDGIIRGIQTRIDQAKELAKVKLNADQAAIVAGDFNAGYIPNEMLYSSVFISALAAISTFGISGAAAIVPYELAKPYLEFTGNGYQDSFDGYRPHEGSWYDPRYSAINTTVTLSNTVAEVFNKVLGTYIIDYIFTKNINTLGTTSWVCPASVCSWLSDHLPVSTQVIINPLFNEKLGKINVTNTSKKWSITVPSDANPAIQPEPYFVFNDDKYNHLYLEKNTFMDGNTDKTYTERVIAWGQKFVIAHTKTSSIHYVQLQCDGDSGVECTSNGRVLNFPASRTQIILERRAHKELNLRKEVY